jgi:MoaA/NifB/PqqE/SkfB family radical SAM enzyme
MSHNDVIGSDSYCCFRSSHNNTLRVLWELNTACNLSCSFCHAKPNVDQGIPFLDVVQGLGILRQMGAGDVIFGGGEPLLRHDLLDIMTEARTLGFDVDLCTNATLVDDVTAAQLAKVLSEVSVSLDSADPESHDRIRGKQGAWDRAVRGIRSLIAHGLDVHLISVVTDRTADGAEPIVDLARTLGVESITLLGLMPFPEHQQEAGRPMLRMVQPSVGTTHRLSHHTRAALQNLLPELRLRNKTIRINTKCVLDSVRTGPCGAGNTILGVDSQGHLLPCILLKGVSDARPLASFRGATAPPSCLQSFVFAGRSIDMAAHAGGCVAVANG